MRVFRDIFRRRGRSLLTISGIAVGVFALVVLGAAAENFNLYIEKAAGYYKDKVVVVDEKDVNAFGLPNGNRPLSLKKIGEIDSVPGVAAAHPGVAMLLDEEAIPTGVPPMVLSVAPGSERYEHWELKQGRAITGDEDALAVVGEDLARQQSLSVGESLKVRGETFEVVGILKRTYINLVDSSAYVSLAEAQQLYADSLPDSFRSVIDEKDLAIQATAYVERSVDPDEVARRIEDDVKGVVATGPADLKKAVGTFVALFNAALASLAALGLLVGGLSIVNTMMMSVAERTRELGVKRALGASRRRVAIDVLQESAVIGLLGGIAGIAFGALAATALNGAATMTTGVAMFVLTWRLALFALVFAALLGTLAGAYPAWRAGRMDPVTALAYQ